MMDRDLRREIEHWIEQLEDVEEHLGAPLPRELGDLTDAAVNAREAAVRVHQDMRNLLFQDDLRQALEATNHSKQSTFMFARTHA